MNDSIMSQTPPPEAGGGIHDNKRTDSTPRPTHDAAGTIDVVNPHINSAMTRIKYKQYLKAEGEVNKKKIKASNFESKRDQVLKSY